MLRAIHGRFLPVKIVLLLDDSEGEMTLGQKDEFYRSLEQLDDRPTVYVCENSACRLPTNEVATLEAILDGRE